MADRRFGNYSSCCRLCLTENYTSLKSVFDDASGNNALVQKISAFVGIEITTNDKFSTLVCCQCVAKINTWSEFKEACSENQTKLEVWMNNWNTTEVLQANFHVKDEPVDCNEYAREPEVILEDENNVPIKMEPMEIQAETVMDGDYEYHHNGSISETDFSDYVGNEVDDNDNDRNCSVCNKLFSTRGNRKKHERTIHGLSSAFSYARSYDAYVVNRKPLTSRVAVDKSISSGSLTSADELSQSSIKTQNDNKNENVADEAAVNENKSNGTNNNEETQPKETSNKSEQPTNTLTEAEKQKIRFAAGLKLQQRTSTPSQNEKLTKIELSYIEKCKAMITMYDTLVCACHNVPYRNMKQLFTHLRALKIWFPVYTCYNCMITFTDRSTNMRHYIKCPRKRLEHLMRLSELRENDEIKTRLYQNFRCTQCKFLFTFYEDFCEHVDVVHVPEEGPYGCICDQSFEKKNELKEHIHQKSCLLEFYCDMCFLITRTLEEFVQHCVESHDKAEGFTLLQEDNFVPRKSSHLRLSSQNDSARNSPAIFYGDKQKPTACTICGRVYSNYHNMMRHFKTHDESENSIPCPECPEKFRLHTHLKEHIGMEHSDFNQKYIYVCPEADCGEAFKTSKDWNKHKESHLVVDCNECGKQFNSSEKLDQHRSVHLNLKVYRDSKTQDYKSESVNANFMCDICKECLPSREEWEEHRMIHDNEETDYTENGDIVEELNVKPDISKKYSCVLCNKSYTGYGGLWDHNKRKHPGRSIARDFPRKCVRCNKIIYNSRAWEMHKNMHVAIEQETKNHSPHPRAAKTRTSSYDADDADESYHTCKRCFKVFSSKYNLRNHMKSHGINIPASTSKYGKSMKHSTTVWCNICHQPCDGFEDLKQHKKEHEMEQMPQLSEEVELIDRKYIVLNCDICNTNFPTQNLLRKHKQEHAIELLNSPMSKRQNYIYCKYCKIPFTTVQLLNDHMNVEHDEMIRIKANEPKQQKKLMRCNYCPKLFNSAGALYSHQGWHKRGTMLRGLQNDLIVPKQEVIKEEILPVPKIHRCSTCPAAFQTDTSLQLHILEKHRNINATLLSTKCNLCNIEFENLNDYEQHRLLHQTVQLKKLKPNPCEYCPSAFTRSDTLFAHIKQVHKDKLKRKLTCRYCNRTFEKQNALTIHLKKHARENYAPSVYVKPPPKVYNCSICHKGFLEAKELRSHTISQHPF